MDIDTDSIYRYVLFFWCLMLHCEKKVREGYVEGVPAEGRDAHPHGTHVDAHGTDSHP
jgi:hypothetical protein